MARIVASTQAKPASASSGERRFEEALRTKLEDDYTCWYDVPIHGRHHDGHPDFIVLHPRRGLLILEVKDWKIDFIEIANHESVVVRSDGGPRSVRNPLEQARDYMFQLVDNLKKSPRLIHQSGHYLGGLLFPFGHGVVLSNITRKQLVDSSLEECFGEAKVICKDEMTESVDAEAFQKKLWGMLGRSFDCQLSLPQLDEIRGRIFPEVMVQQNLFAKTSTTEGEDIIKVMDLQQEEMARSLGAGHRVIHGVAGSGKTMILGFRAERLARACQRPILTLCYNKALASKLGAVVRDKGISDRVHVLNFHKWVNQQLTQYNVKRPVSTKDVNQDLKAMVETLIRAVDLEQVPRHQYDAVLIDEGHDFQPEWFKLVVQMIHPQSDNLLVMYDDAQSIYQQGTRKHFSFASVGIKAVGRTTILRKNYRNTRQVLQAAHAFAAEIFKSNTGAEDMPPIIEPESVGRAGPLPELKEFHSVDAEISAIAARCRELHIKGKRWSDMALLYPAKWMGETATKVLTREGIPFSMLSEGKVAQQDAVQLVTLHSSKGLEFSFVGIAGLGRIPRADGNPNEDAKLLYVGMTRSTGELLMTHSSASPFVDRMRSVLAAAA